ncbi:MAG: SHOCT domain-containing protein [Gammaproteobacteria bacterium]|nr:SHOCT domain-containing protein [Gammaproteobacteria bacterium]
MLIVLLAGCGLLEWRAADLEAPLPGEVTPDSYGVYTRGNYLYVSRESRDESLASVAPNDHPLDISASQIRVWLRGLEVRPEEGGEPISLVPTEQLSELSATLAQALGDASPDEDVVFHVFRTAGSWFGSERRVTTARVFYRDDSLNLIFGELDDFYSEQIDRDLHPLKPGFRGTDTDVSGEVIASPQIAFVDGRADWIRLDRSAIAAAPVAPRRLAPAPVIAAPAASPLPKDPRWSQLEERLLILDGLRSKGLITEEDYEIKKRELLDILDL